VAANHGGEVTVWSVEGEGATFTLRLPEAAQRVRGAAARPVTAASGSATSPGTRLGTDQIHSQKESTA
jgi:two-component system sensor histidine kinase SenX3